MSQFNLADLWEAIADQVPERVALRCQGQQRTYAQLEERANRVAHWFLDQGVQPDDHIGLYMQNDFAYLEGTLAAYKIRAVPINVNFRYVGEELRHLFNDADLVGVVAGAEYAAGLAEVAAGVPTLRWSLAVGADYDAALAASSPARDFGPRSGDDHYILYTGGTTGLPKGVVWRQEDAFFACMGGGDPSRPEVTSIDELVERIAPEQSIFLLLAPLMHAAGGWTSMLHLLSGNRVVLW
jgi:acyl-CoA synthetase (AMP-forming)/AMP-acid ligase II